MGLRKLSIDPRDVAKRANLRAMIRNAVESAYHAEELTVASELLAILDDIPDLYLIARPMRGEAFYVKPSWKSAVTAIAVTATAKAVPWRRSR